MPDLLFSGVQPTNNLHIGNYIGALKQWVEIQHRYRCLFCVVDLHAITVPQDPKILRQNILNVAATYLAAGVDPARCDIFVQSEVPEHAELGWILSTIIKVSELERMTQFKDKSIKRGENVGVGLFTYPALMAADILLYDTSVVPVGEDQVQHLELTRLVGRRFNTQFGETFVIPQPLIQKVGARIMALDEPTAKMSKSALSANSYIALSDSPDVIRKKISKAVTDSGTGIAYDAIERPAISNLLTIFHHATGRSMKDIEDEYANKGYADFKKALAEAVVTMLEPIQKKLRLFQDDPAELSKILDRGRDKARGLAAEKIKQVREKVGLGR
ncbi:tryptophan--tRNA ligase [Patescibacteria group bacterium]|nr:tryptophan--tRNA ligase [Patescibacteria group bacterium]